MQEPRRGAGAVPAAPAAPSMRPPRGLFLPLGALPPSLGKTGEGEETAATVK